MITIQRVVGMKLKNLPEVDIRLIIFIILLMLLPFILFSENEHLPPYRFDLMMPVDTIGDDVSGIVIEYENDTLKEHYPGLFSSVFIHLVSVPSDTVTITFTPDIQLDLGEGPGVSVELIFPPYPVAMLPQNVKVKPVDDILFEDYHYGTILFDVNSDDAIYNAYTIDNLSYLIEDDDLLPGINFSYNADTVLTEGLTGVTWLFSMNSIPSDTVYITTDPDEDIRITAIPDEAVTLIFPPNASALTWQDLQVRAYDDDIYEGPHSGLIGIEINTDDVVYSMFEIDDVIYPVIDNDSAPGILFTYEMDTFLTEGLTGIPLLFSLNSVPSDTVYMTVDPDAQMRIGALPDDPVTLIFEPNGSALAIQSVNIRAFDDVVFEGPHTGLLQFDIASDDADYDGWIFPDFTFSIEDNDAAPGIHFTVPPDLILNEWEGEIEMTISLNSVPEDTVHIQIIPDDQLVISGGAGIAYDLALDPNGSALNDHVISVKAFNDFEYEGTHTGIVSFIISSGDAVYDAFELAPLTFSINDDDLMPGIIFDDTTSLAQVEGDTTLSFSVVLGSIPEFTVTLNLQPDIQLDLGKGRGNDVNLKFKGDSALIAQSVIVIPFDDLSIEGDHIGKIGCTVMSDDPVYNAIIIDTIVVDITDNDGDAIIQYDPSVFTVSPTISSGYFSLQSSGFDADLLEVYNSSGALVYSLHQPGQLTEIDLSFLSSGSYSIIIKNKDRAYYSPVRIIH